MASEFERRIAAAAKRKSAARRTGAQEQRLNLVKAAISDWQSRIGPMIEQAVSMANQQLDDVGVCLKISNEIGHSIEPGPALPMRPIISISSEPSSQGKADLQGGVKNGAAEHAGLAPAIRIGLQPDGCIFVTAQHCTIPRRPFVPSSQVDKAQIRAIVADYVDAIIPVLR